MPGKLEATPELFDVVPFQEDRQHGIAEHREFWIRLGCARSPRPRGLQLECDNLVACIAEFGEFLRQWYGKNLCDSRSDYPCKSGH